MIEKSQIEKYLQDAEFNAIKNMARGKWSLFGIVGIIPPKWASDIEFIETITGSITNNLGVLALKVDYDKARYEKCREWVDKLGLFCTGTMWRTGKVDYNDQLCTAKIIFYEMKCDRCNKVKYSRGFIYNWKKLPSATKTTGTKELNLKACEFCGYSIASHPRSDCFKGKLKY